MGKSVRRMSYRTFITYSGEDENLAQWIYDSLGRIVQIQPYKAEIYPDYGEDFKKRLQDELYESHFMVVLLTNNGIHSQWVNQEIVFAYALKTRLRPLYKGRPHIIPISQKQTELKGFITKDSIDILFLEDFSDFENVIANIIFTIRKYIPRGLEKRVLRALVTCSNCVDEEGLPFEYENFIPSHETIRKIMESDPQPLWAYSCPSCHTKNAIDARTFLPIRLSPENSASF